PLTPCRGGHGLVVNLKAAHAKNLPSRETAYPIADPDLARERRAGDDQPMSLQEEDPVYRQSEVPGRRLLLTALENLCNARSDLVQPLSGDGREPNDRRALQGCSCRQDLDFLLDLGDSRVGRQIDLRDYEDRAVDPEQVEDVQVFLGLRHHAVVGCDGEEHEVDAVGSREHVADEALVSWNIDDSGARAAGKVQVREAQVD